MMLLPGFSTLRAGLVMIWSQGLHLSSFPRLGSTTTYWQKAPLLSLGIIFLYHVDGRLLASEAPDHQKHFVGS